ncbi:MAG: GNAT family N-acetyltransferase, partial [Candidatus Bathyarchaeia archaeon]
MTRSDAEFAARLTSTAGWGFTRRDFQRILTLTPEGCFIAVRDGRRVGLLTTVTYGDVAWIGNVVVDEKMRGKGVGSRLLEHALNHLKDVGVSTVGLYAYTHAIDFYEALNFKVYSKFVRMSREARKLPYTGIRRMRPSDLYDAAKLDEACVGFSRRSLLEWRLKDEHTSGFAAEAEDKVVGYLLKEKSSTVEIGPWVCLGTHEGEAANLLKAAVSSSVGSMVQIGVLKENADILRLLSGLGFKQASEVVSMYHKNSKPPS